MNGGYASQVAAPLWGRFMRPATAGDSAAWFEPPATVTSALVCRLSGHLATSDCRDAVTIAADGTPVQGASVYVEHFLRGTEPVDWCPIHQRREPIGRALRAVAGWFSPSDRQTQAVLPVLPEASASPVPPPPTAETEPAPEPREQRRGIWSRLFGLGRNRR